MSSPLIALLFDGLIETLVMVAVSGGIAALLGVPLGVILILTDRGGILQNLGVNRVLGLIVNATRSTPFIILMVAVIVGSTRRDLIEAAYTLGADSRGIVRRVMLPGAAPQIAETLRLVLGWAWTYVIVAELVGAESGIGHMIMDSQRLLDTGQMIFGIFCIGVIGLVSDLLFKWANQRLYPWAF